MEQKEMRFSEFTPYYTTSAYVSIDEQSLADVQSKKQSLLSVIEKIPHAQLHYLKCMELIGELIGEEHGDTLDGFSILENTTPLYDNDNNHISLNYELFETWEGDQLYINKISYSTIGEVKEFSTILENISKEEFLKRLDIDETRDTAGAYAMEIEEMTDEELTECLWTELQELKAFFSESAKHNRYILVCLNAGSEDYREQGDNE